MNTTSRTPDNPIRQIHDRALSTLPELFESGIKRALELAQNPTPTDTAEAQRLTRASLTATHLLRDLITLAQSLKIREELNTGQLDELITLARAAVAQADQYHQHHSTSQATSNPPSLSTQPSSPTPILEPNPQSPDETISISKSRHDGHHA